MRNSDPAISNSVLESRDRAFFETYGDNLSLACAIVRKTFHLPKKMGTEDVLQYISNIPARIFDARFDPITKAFLIRLLSSDVKSPQA